MFTRRRFLGYSALAPATLTLRPLLRTLSAQEAGNSPSRMPAPHISEKAMALHRRAFIFDAHVHALDREFYKGGSMGTRKTDGYWDLPRAREGGVGAFFLSVYIPEEYYPGRFETKQALRRVEDALEELEQNRDQVELALNAAAHDRGRPRVGPRETLRRDAGRRGGTQRGHAARFDHRERLPVLRVGEDDQPLDRGPPEAPGVAREIPVGLRREVSTVAQEPGRLDVKAAVRRRNREDARSQGSALGVKPKRLLHHVDAVAKG